MAHTTPGYGPGRPTQGRNARRQGCCRGMARPANRYSRCFDTIEALAATGLGWQRRSGRDGSSWRERCPAAAALDGLRTPRVSPPYRRVSWTALEAAALILPRPRGI